VKELFEQRASDGKEARSDHGEPGTRDARNTTRWIHHQRAFLAGHPMERISDVRTPEPEWRGLGDVDVTRLKAAAGQLIHIHTRVDQNALRDQCILLVMLDTAFRVSELVSLDLEQYEGKHFRNVSGREITSPTASSWDRRDGRLWTGTSRGSRRVRGPLFNRRGVEGSLRRTLPTPWVGLWLRLTPGFRSASKSTYPHVLRHTALRKMAEKRASGTHSRWPATLRPSTSGATYSLPERDGRGRGELFD